MSSSYIKNQNLAPIAAFVFNRPDHTRFMLESLRENILSQESKLYIFCDGPRDANDQEKVDEVRAVVRDKDWCGNVEIIEQQVNQGLATSIIAGVSRLCQKYGRVIVLEDDLVLDPKTLEYMNQALDHFADDENVMQVSGYMFPIENIGVDHAFLMPFVTSWGWATWNRAWKLFDEDCAEARKELESLDTRRRFNVDNSYDYSGMLLKQLEGKIDSWAIRWNWTVFQNSGRVLYPPFSLIANHGFDGSGTHGSRSRNYNQVAIGSSSNSDRAVRMPVSDEIATDQLELTINYFRKSSLTLLGRIKAIAKRIVGQ